MTQAKKKLSGWHPEDIKAAIRKLGTSLAELSRRHGFHPDSARIALRRADCPAVDRMIGDFLGVGVGELWPERYTRRGARRG